MANAIITFKIMPESPDIDLDSIKIKAKEIAKEGGSMGEMLVQEQPIAFGLKAVIVKAMYPVNDSIDYDSIAGRIAKIKGVNTAEVTGMDLPLG
jgi:elongation factor 1-beta